MSRELDNQSKHSDALPGSWGERMGYWRRALEWSQADLAERVGRDSRQTIGYQENADEPGTQVRMLVELCNASAAAREDLLGFLGLEAGDSMVPVKLVSLIRRARRLDDEDLDNLARILDDALRMVERRGPPREHDSAAS